MENIKEHYRNLFQLYGDSYKSAQWSDRATQNKRFKVLCDIADLNGKKVLDFGCGTGDLATFLKEEDINVRYTGVDIVDELLECAREKHPEYSFGNLEQFEDQQFDYILISGVFNNKIDDNRKFYESTLKKLSNQANEGIAFNLLSNYVDYYDENLFYENPEDVFKYVKTLTPYVTIRNEYQLKEKIIPFEFTTYLYFKG